MNQSMSPAQISQVEADRLATLLGRNICPEEYDFQEWSETAEYRATHQMASAAFMLGLQFNDVRTTIIDAYFKLWEKGISL